MPTIINFYHQLEIIPSNLIRHQLEVAAVSQRLTDHWLGQKLDQKLVIQAALLHDLGNLVKYTFPLQSEMYHEVIADEALWHKRQVELIKMYGVDADKVTEKILQEHGFHREADLLKEIRLGKYTHDVDHISDEARIVFLADGMVSPRGIVGIKTRVEDVKKRYHGNKKMLLWVKALQQNQAILQARIALDLFSLETYDYSKLINALKGWQLEIG